jgi:hypothetical protein
MKQKANPIKINSGAVVDEFANFTSQYKIVAGDGDSDRLLTVNNSHYRRMEESQ